MIILISYALKRFINIRDASLRPVPLENIGGSGDNAIDKAMAATLASIELPDNDGVIELVLLTDALIDAVCYSLRRHLPCLLNC